MVTIVPQATPPAGAVQVIIPSPVLNALTFQPLSVNRIIVPAGNGARATKAKLSGAVLLYCTIAISPAAKVVEPPPAPLFTSATVTVIPGVALPTATLVKLTVWLLPVVATLLCEAKVVAPSLMVILAAAVEMGELCVNVTAKL